MKLSRRGKPSPAASADVWIKRTRAAVEKSLRASVPPGAVKPATIHRAMRYGLLAGGKRLRPILCCAAAEACGGSTRGAMPAACAVELVHTYSLIHDDLPCMDDDDLRRGRPTSHKVFGEGIAVLAGDALLTSAFAVLATARPQGRYGVGDLVTELAGAAGSRGLIAGQVADLEAEGKKPSEPSLYFIHAAKTGMLLRAALKLGAMCAGAQKSEVGALDRFGFALGLAFQVQDDILDATQSAKKLGKTAGKDAAAGKMTFPSLYGLERSRELSAYWTEEAVAALQPLGAQGEMLRLLAAMILVRDR
ncbi:MAG: polyprenyl synthetase family protein [Chthoniobacterales bacterium]|nr:polyprenyl synthetase family protein [Chthoniobacterales bacterium]